MSDFSVVLKLISDSAIMKFFAEYVVEKGVEGIVDYTLKKFSRNSVEYELIEALDESLFQTCSFFEWEYDTTAITESFVLRWNKIRDIDSANSLKGILEQALGMPVSVEEMEFWIFSFHKQVTKPERKWLNNFIVLNHLFENNNKIQHIQQKAIDIKNNSKQEDDDFLQNLSICLSDLRRPTIVTGWSGSGKTVYCKHMVKRLYEEYRIPYFYFNSCEPIEGVKKIDIESLNFNFFIPYHHTSFKAHLSNVCNVISYALYNQSEDADIYCSWLEQFLFDFFESRNVYDNNCIGEMVEVLEKGNIPESIYRINLLSVLRRNKVSNNELSDIQQIEKVLNCQEPVWFKSNYSESDFKISIIITYLFEKLYADGISHPKQLKHMLYLDEHCGYIRRLAKSNTIGAKFLKSVLLQLKDYGEGMICDAHELSDIPIEIIDYSNLKVLANQDDILYRYSYRLMCCPHYALMIYHNYRYENDFWSLAQIKILN